MKAGLLFYISTILVGASALPSLRSLQEIAHIDKRDGGRYLSHEPLLSSRSASQCQNLSVEEALSRGYTSSL
ncbi:hypothetical protein EV421DRAFT_986966 [Armillaria borealis]|uniref:Uncharacterized protein n=1 Tax=Armillaria borealis TaxID=47425 RepID=A0AA39MLG8_9AGAR|nr:hypothetical protein EV421DRAFT_986966 [Armillaria borealis]